MKFTRQLYQTSHAKTFGDFAYRQIDSFLFVCSCYTECENYIGPNYRICTTYVQLLTFIMVKSVHCCVTVLKEPGGLELSFIVLEWQL